MANIVATRQVDDFVSNMIPNIHIDGPFLHPAPGYIGVHHSLDTAKKLIDAAGGLFRTVTLAPVSDPGLKVTCWLANQDIMVSAGNYNPLLEELKAATAAGLSMFTHYVNGCPMNLSRHDNCCATRVE